MAIGLLLLTQTILISITIGLSTYSFWFSYILFLVFLGGILILFIYVTSLASNEPFVFRTSISILIILTLTLSISPLLIDSLISPTKASLPFSSLEFTQSTRFIVRWIYNSPSIIFTLYIISYLLLTLIVVVKIVNLFKGPLRLIN